MIPTTGFGVIEFSQGSGCVPESGEEAMEPGLLVPDMRRERVRRWELIVFVRIWRFEINKAYGRYRTFLRKTWIGPFCLKVWSNPKSISSVSHPVRIAW